MDYISNDRKKIGTKEEVLQYEADVRAKEATKAKLAEEKQARKDEIKASYETLLGLIERYRKDYNEPVRFNSKTASYDLFDPFHVLDKLAFLLG